MTLRYLHLPFLFSAALAFAQLDSNSVTVTSSRNANLQPDEAVFGVYVDSPTSTTLDDVLAALAGSGITMTNFIGVSTVQNPGGTEPPPPGLEWVFAVTAPIAKTKDTIATLTSLQARVTQAKSGLVLSFAVQGTQVSPKLQQSQPCTLSDLIADARAQAQKLADAAGMPLGPILAASSATLSTSTAGIVAPGISFNRFTLISSSFSVPAPCTATVKFALGRFF